MTIPDVLANGTPPRACVRSGLLRQDRRGAEAVDRRLAGSGRARRRLRRGRPGVVIADYTRVLDQVDLASIDARERVTRHDVKARIEEFNALAGHEHIHKGMTSRDLTENIEQRQVLSSLELIRERIVTVLVNLSRLAVQYRDVPMAGRSHNVAAQTTTLGKRFSNAADELLVAFTRVDELIGRYPARGIKGPMGTAQDMLDLLGGDTAKLASLEQRVAEHLGFARVLTATGQVYPRSLDHDVLSALVEVAAAPSSLAMTIRLMAGQELVTEGFKEGQVGSSAMPHKMNTRSCERVNGLMVVLRGYASMAAELAGAQWNEGDVFCSVGGEWHFRRVLCAGRHVRDLPHGAGRVRRVPGGDRGRASALSAVPDDDEGADGRCPARRRTRDRARGDQGTLGGGGAGHAQRRRDQRPGRPARFGPSARPLPRPAGRRSRRPAWTHRLGARAQVDRIAARVSELAVRFPEGAAYHPGSVL